MKTLYLLRHAKSDWANPLLPDHDRPLAPRGRREAPEMGRAFREKGGDVDRIVCSTALRIRETLELFQQAAGLQLTPEPTSTLYAASPALVVDLVRRLPAECGSVLVAGHNPVMEETVLVLTGRIMPMPTAAMARIDFDLESWGGVGNGKGRLAWHLTPKGLQAGKKG